MKILHLYKSYYPDTIGGCEQLIKTLSQEMRKYHCQHYLLTTSKFLKKKTTLFWEASDENLKIKRCKTSLEFSSCPVSIELFQRFKYYADQVDILHFHHPWPYSDLVYLAHRINKPTLMTYHSDIVRQRVLNIFYKPILKKMLTRMDAIVTTSENYLRTSTVLRAYQQKCHVIPIGLNQEDYSFNNLEKSAQWKKKLGNHFFLFIGVLRYYKGLHLLLDAVKNTTLAVVIAGTGELEETLKQRIKHENISNVTLLGAVSHEDKCTLLQLCRAVVIPSHLRSEAFCISLLEGLLFRKALISTELGTGTSFVNQHNKTGLVVPPGDPIALRSAMICLSNKEAVVKKMEAAAYAHYEKNFTATQMAHSYYALYQKLSHGE